MRKLLNEHSGAVIGWVVGIGIGCLIMFVGFLIMSSVPRGGVAGTVTGYTMVDVAPGVRCYVFKQGVWCHEHSD